MPPRLKRILCLVALVPAMGASPPSKAGSPRFVPPPDSLLIASYSFDDGTGGPDAMGWTTLDLTAREGTRFHVDDFAGLGGGSFGGLAPLEGARSLWCGAAPATEVCAYASLPGYGKRWTQRFMSIPFSVSGDVTVSFLARFDSEAGYDQTYLHYYTRSGRWESLGTFDEGTPFADPADSLVSETIPADSLNGTVQIRFVFTSDGAWDDEDGLYDTDGAVIIDSLLVTDDLGTVDYQDFESEAVGDTATADGDWSADAVPFGDYAALVDGTTVLQEDSTTANDSYLWGFFQGSPDTYACGGHPEQPIVPFHVDGFLGGAVDNRAVSPVVDMTSFLVGDSLPDSLVFMVEYDVYKDFAFPFWPFSTSVRNVLSVRSLVGGCWQDWTHPYAVAGGFGEWDRVAFDITPSIDPAATEIQVALGVTDTRAPFCQSHAPLIDNVVFYTTGVVPTGVPNPVVPSAVVLHQNHPNPFNPTTRIQFEIPQPGAPVSLRIYDVRGRLVRVLRQGFFGPGLHTVEWDGKNRQGGRVGSGVYFYRLETPGFKDTRKMILLQ